MVQQIEHLGAKLDIKSFCNLRVLGDREVGVQEAGSGDGIATEASGMTAAGNYRVVAAARSCRGAAKRTRYSKSRTGGRGAGGNCWCPALGRSIKWLAHSFVVEILRWAPGTRNTLE